jgi:hypothetical protein
MLNVVNKTWNNLFGWYNQFTPEFALCFPEAAV